MIGKHTSLLVVLCLFVSLTGIASAQTLSNANLMGYWQFEETSGSIAWDSSTNFINGTLTPTGIEMDVEGRWGKGYYFFKDGTNGWINLGTNAISALTNSLTVSFWVKKNATGWATVINACNVIDTNGTREISWSVIAHDGAQHAAWRSDTLPGLKPNGTTALDDFEWHHVVGVYERGVGFSIYVDGALDVFAANANGPLSTNYQINIGSFLDSNDQNMYIGFLDDVAVFDGALDTNEIYCAYTGGVQALMGMPSQVPGTNVVKELIAWYQFEETSGTNAYDSSGNNLHGNINDGISLNHPGVYGRSYFFNADNSSWVNCGSNALFDIKSDITVLAWTRTYKKGWETAVAFDLPGENAAWRLGRNPLGTNAWYLGTNTWAGYRVEGDSINGCYDTNWVSPNVIDDDVWHFAAYTRERWAQRSSLYYDGRLVGGVSNANLNPFKTGKQLCIGTLSGEGNQWRGWIDEVAIYKGALSSNEIYTIYTGGVYAVEGVPYPPSPPQYELVAWYKCDEGIGTNVYDSWTNELHGAFTGTGVTHFTPGKFQDGYHVNRPSKHYARIETNDLLELDGPLTVSCWAKINAGWPMILVSKAWGSGWESWKILSDVGQSKFNLNGIGDAGTTNTAHIGDGNWHMFTGIYDMQTRQMRFYIDDECVATNNLADDKLKIVDSSIFAMYPLNIGGYPGDPGLHEYIDEVSLWRGVLTTNEIYMMYTGGVRAVMGITPPVPVPPELVAWWKLDETSGNIAYDTSTNNVEGTNMSGVTVGQPGKFGTSYYFDGSTNGWVDFGFSNAVSLSPSPLTIVAWVNHTASGLRKILNCGWYDPATNKWFPSWGFGANDDGAKINWAWRGKADVTGLGINDGDWHLITAVQDRYGPAPKTHLYVDDQLVGTADDNGGAAFENPGQLLAMGSKAGKSDYFLGNIDDVAVFAGVLYSNDVEYIYNYGLDEFFMPTPKGSIIIIQ